MPGDRWSVTAANWPRAHHDGAAAPVVLASTQERAWRSFPSAALKQHAVDVPANPSALETERHRPYPANDLTHTAAGLYPTASDG